MLPGGKIKSYPETKSPHVVVITGQAPPGPENPALHTQKDAFPILAGEFEFGAQAKHAVDPACA